MNLNRRHFLGAAIAVTAGAATPAAFAEPSKTVLAPLPARPKQADMPPLLREALAALDSHGSRIVHRDLIGLVDFSEHSSNRRFQLVDVASGDIAASYLVAHGRGSDPRHTGWVQSFSNRPGSNASSRGSYLVANSYYGKHGRSRRLIGLDPDNNLALERAIVIHGASYVDRSMMDRRSGVGRSLGCFSVAENKIADVLDRLGEGYLLYASKQAHAA